MNTNLDMVVAIGENQQDFQNCLARVLRLTPGQITALTEDGFERAEDLVGWSYKEVKTWCTDKAKLSLNRGG